MVLVDMVTIKGIIMSLKTTNDFLGSVMLSIDRNPRHIEFRNGFAELLSWTEYRSFRQLVYSGFQLHRANSSANREYYEGMGFDLPVYVAEKRGYRIFFDKSMLVVLGEPLEKEYAIEVKGKNVLDIGAYKGETAVWFKMMGAKNLVLYEPMKENLSILKLNLIANQISAEIHEEGISDHDGEAGIKVSESSVRKLGPEMVRVRVRNVSDVLQNSNCDIAKIDCEGAEINLIKVDGGILRLLDGYEVECHSFEIRDAIKKKFINEGFRLSNKYKYNSVASVLCFQRL